LPTSPTLLSRYSRRRASRSRPSTARGPTRAILAPTLHTSPCERSACQIPSHQPSRMPPKNSVPSYLKKATPPPATPDRIVGYFGLWIYGRNVVCFARWKGRLQPCHKNDSAKRLHRCPERWRRVRCLSRNMYSHSRSFPMACKFLVDEVAKTQAHLWRFKVAHCRRIVGALRLYEPS